MTTKNDIIEIIFNCVDEINQQHGFQMPKDINTKLYGFESGLDSIGLVNLIVNIEENINTVLNVSITIADEKAMSQKYSPFKTIETLSNYIMELLDES